MTKAPLNINNGADSLNLSLNAKSEFAVNQENATILNRPTNLSNESSRCRLLSNGGVQVIAGQT